MVMKTNFSTVVRNFLDKMESWDSAASLRENGCIDRITMHIACMCTRQENCQKFYIFFEFLPVFDDC